MAYGRGGNPSDRWNQGWERNPNEPYQGQSFRSGPDGWSEEERGTQGGGYGSQQGWSGGYEGGGRSGSNFPGQSQSMQPGGMGGYEEYGSGPATGRSSRYGTQSRYGRGVQGRHAGRGPKGYSRSDARIEEEINESLARDPDIDASEIEVKVENGVVTLTGSVEEREDKRNVEDPVENVFGVRDVENRLKLAGKNESSSSERSSSSAGRQESHRESGRSLKM